MGEEETSQEGVRDRENSDEHWVPLNVERTLGSSSLMTGGRPYPMGQRAKQRGSGESHPGEARLRGISCMEMDAWDEGDSYEPYVGRWSRLVAEKFLDWLTVAPGSDWVDVGCGTGALTGVIAGKARPNRLAGIDPSSAFIATARARLGDGADLRVGDAQALPYADDEFDAAVSGLALNFIPDPGQAVREMRRVTRAGKTVAVYVWDYAEGMEMMRVFWDAAVALDPEAGDLDEGRRFPICRPESLTEVFRTAGLEDVEVRALDIETRFQGFDDYWQPFLGRQGPAPSYVSTLGDDRRARLRERLESELSPSSDGVIGLTARAWAVKGVV